MGVQCTKHDKDIQYKKYREIRTIQDRKHNKSADNSNYSNGKGVLFYTVLFHRAHSMDELGITQQCEMVNSLQEGDDVYVYNGIHQGWVHAVVVRKFLNGITVRWVKENTLTFIDTKSKCVPMYIKKIS